MPRNPFVPFMLISSPIVPHLRYSFLGIDPCETLRVGPNEEKQGDPFVHLENLMEKYQMFQVPELNLPLTGGAIGYSAFEIIRHYEPRIEQYISQQKDVLQIPEAIYMIFKTIVVFDSVFQTYKVITHVNANIKENVNLEEEYQAAKKRIEMICKIINENNSNIEPSIINSRGQVSAGALNAAEIDINKLSNTGKKGYEEFVKTLKHHIVDGDIFQAVPSHRTSVPLLNNVDPINIYRQLRVINPSPYMYYLDLGGWQIVGASPEMLVKVNENKIVETHPIAGTRPRGKTEEEDQEIAFELLKNEKECAEHIMLVDLARNDLGRISEIGTVHVERLMAVERYSHVMHIVSVTKGKLDKNKTVYDAYRALFPAGTLSGAPKVKAMELICSLEKEKRGVYSGTVGYVSFHGVLDTAIAIRTIVVKDGKAYVQAGGGIVYDSDPQDEYIETVNKMRSSLRTIEATISASNVD